VTTSYADDTSNHSKSSAPQSSARVAWLYPSLAQGNYWQPLFSHFSQQFPQTVIYTGVWTGFAAGFEGKFKLEVVGETKEFHTIKTDKGYGRSYMLPSWKIVPKLLAFKPEIIFTSAFSLWTLVALLFKLLFGSRVIVLLDGVSPGVDYLNSGKSRVIPRRVMSKLIDAFIANSQAGKTYLTETVWADDKKVFVQPYLVPDTAALSDGQGDSKTDVEQASAASIQQPVFLFIGQIVSRKGIEFLIEACSLLKKQGDRQFTLLIVGKGPERPALEALVQQEGLEESIRWVGEVEYNQLGACFEQADVFVSPTLEDIWGMVVPEAMAFGKPVLCSKWAGATEIMVDGDNGYIFDPYDVEQLAALMDRFVAEPSLIERMGDRSKELSCNLTPKNTARFFCQLAETL